MKKACLIFMMLSPVVLANNVDELIGKFEQSNIYSADWYEQGSSKVAESSNKYRDIKVNLTETKGSIAITLTQLSQFNDLSISPCYKLMDYVAYEKSDSWSDPDTQDELLIRSVFSPKTKVGEENKANLNGWNVSLKRLPSGLTCEVVKSK
ncbi:hypothetical protein ACED34_04410 [Vibrio splendidus]|uniref:hypothetical protein n=1 Tax=Vibrio splendidus TaxID=29497 RepID=UPI00352D04BA